MLTFECGVGPRLRIRKGPGEGTSVGRRSSMGQGLCLGPARKGRGSMWKGGPLECGVPEFGGRTLSEGVWVGFRPSVLEGVSEGGGGGGGMNWEMGIDIYTLICIK